MHQQFSLNKHNPPPFTLNIPLPTTETNKKKSKLVLNKSLLLPESRKPPTLILRTTPFWLGLHILSLSLLLQHHPPTMNNNPKRPTGEETIAIRICTTLYRKES
jgi:hypothetical protein